MEHLAEGWCLAANAFQISHMIIKVPPETHMSQHTSERGLASLFLLP